MPYTEMENITPTKLALITERARKEPQFQFTSLVHLLNERFLSECYYKLGRDRANGIDNVSWKEYGERLEENLSELVTRMKAKQYKPQPVKRVYIPKNNKEKRPLGLPALEDKIVQKGIVRILEAIYEVDFLDCSYGFRPGKNCHDAVKAVDNTIMTKPINHVIEADIKGCFDNISHEWMMKCLQVRINDSSLLLLIRRFLKSGYSESGKVVVTEQGTAQGGNLSPMMANIFLHYGLDLWFEKAVKPRVRGVCKLVRYADDFICMVQYKDEAEQIERALRKRFEKFGLELHPNKTRVISFGRYERENAVKGKLRANTFDFLGFTHYCGISRKGNFIVGRKTSRKKFRIKCIELNRWFKIVRNTGKPKEWWPILKSKLRGHYQYYGVSGNMRSIQRYYELTRKMAFKWLNRRSNRNSFDWERFEDYLNLYPLPKPRITYSLYELSHVR